jgi:hypothetical protein
MRNISGLFLLVFLVGCSHSECKNIPQRDAALAAQQQSSPTPTESVTPVNTKSEANSKLIQIYKETGAKQCGEGDAIPLQKVKEQLTKNKVEPLDAKTQSDGYMHMQVCGAPTGEIHVFTIQKSQLKRATALGFKILK